MNLKKRTMDEMITHFNDVVSEMNIPSKEKMTLLGMVTAIGYEAQNAADVVPVRHGRWEKATGMMPPEYCGLHICSECGHYAGKKPPYGGREMLSDYCPNCGARMDGDGE